MEQDSTTFTSLQRGKLHQAIYVKMSIMVLHCPLSGKDGNAIPGETSLD